MTVVDTAGSLVVMRHGQSVWNHANRFTGWTDIGLTAQGMADAQRAGANLRSSGFRFDLAVTSSLTRASDTLAHVVSGLSDPVPATVRSWRLNDRHYGALTGMEKEDAARVFGADKVRAWRRGFDQAPPPLDATAQRVLLDALGADIERDRHAMPNTESLRDTLARLLPLWDDVVAPALLRHESVLLVGHGNSLRALFKHLHRIDDTAIASIEVAHTQPLLLRFDTAMNIVSRESIGG